MTKTRIEMHEGSIIPFWYGIAYWRWDAAVGVFYPIPINVIVRLSREVYFWFKRGLYETWEDAMVKKIRRQAYESARECFGPGSRTGR